MSDVKQRWPALPVSALCLLAIAALLPSKTNADAGELVAIVPPPDLEGSNTPFGTPQFGRRVALDGNLAVIAAHSHDWGTAPRNKGQVHVVNLRTHAIDLTFSNPQAKRDNEFGYSVAVSGQNIVVGARRNDPPGAPQGGMAYLYRVADDVDGNVVQVGSRTTLSQPNPSAGAAFGTAVAIEGSLIAVGAPGYTEPGRDTNTGAIYLFDASDPAADPIQQVGPAAPDSDGDRFGEAVAVSRNRIVVGAPAHREPGNRFLRTGLAYVYEEVNGSVEKKAELVPPRRKSYASFGQSVDIDGSLVVVGAPKQLHADSGETTGEAYVFVIEDNTPVASPVATLRNPDPTADDEFGASVSISGTTVLVGSHLDDPDGKVDAGTVYVFDAISGHLLGSIENPSPGSGGGHGDRFGIGIDIDCDLVIAGAEGEDITVTGTPPNNIHDVGAGYFYHLNIH